MPTLIAVVVGGALGAAWAEAFGALVGALVGWLFVRHLALERRVAELQKALEDRQAAGAVRQPVDAAPVPGEALPRDAAPSVGRTFAPADATPAAERSAPSTFGAPAVQRTFEPGDADPAARASAALEGAAAPAVSSAAPATASTAAPSAAPRAGPPSAGALEPLRRWLFGGNTIVKAGVAILFVGLAFLAKYASEHVMLPIEWRLASIGAVALVLLAIGWRLRVRRAAYAQVLQGGAVAVLYLLLFVAFRYYALLPVGAAFGLMVAVAALSAALAVLQDARSLAVIGALGGFATPLLISSGSGNVVALFAYYLVLDLGIALVAWYRTWRSLNLIGFVATFGVATAWGVLQYRPERYAMSQAFLIAYFLVFVAILLMPARAAARPRTHGEIAARSDAWVQGSLLFGLPTIVFVLQYGLVRDTPYGAAFSALGLAAFYVLIATLTRSKPELRLPFEATLAIATVFLTLVVPFALDARSTGGAWALEGAGLVWLGFRQQRGLPRVFGYVLLLFAGAALLLGSERYGAPTNVLNGAFVNALLIAAGSLAAAFFVHRHAPRRASAGTAAGAASRGAEPTAEPSRRSVDVDTDANADAPAAAGSRSAEPVAEPLLIGWATLWLLVAANVEIELLAGGPGRFIAGWLVAASLIALLLLALGRRLGWREVTFPAIGFTPALAVAALAGAALLDAPTDAGGAWAWPIALVVHGLLLRWAAPGWPRFAHDLAHALGALVIAGLGALQGRSVTAGWGDASSAWPWLGWLVVPAALLWLVTARRSRSLWPISAAPGIYAEIVGGVLAAAVLFWSVVANALSDGSAAPLPHLPLVNPLDLGVAFALVAAWRWTKRRATRRPLTGDVDAAARAPSGRFDSTFGAWPLGFVAAAGFVWLNAILVRAFHHYAGVPYRFDAWTASLAVQTGITLLWTATALGTMWLAARRSARLPWMAGAALLGAVVVKLLIVDLSGSGTVTRIVSFIGVGVLMLVIGYVAPLPSRPALERSGDAA